jgi:integrase/recombinase XerD
MESLDPVPRFDREPRHVPDEKMILNLLSQPDEHTYHGIRDKAVLELLYSTGVRSKELLLLKVQDIDLKDSSLMILNGKGGRQRMVPFGKSAALALEKYLEVTRPHYLKNPNLDILFLSKLGGPLKEWGLYEIIKRYGAKSGHTKGMTAHTLRHACALHMLKGGAPIEAVQELLGHKRLSTTQIYTTLLPQDLKAVHEKFHPREQSLPKEGFSQT